MTTDFSRDQERPPDLEARQQVDGNVLEKVAEVFARQQDALIQLAEVLANSQHRPELEDDPEVLEVRRTIALIKAKDFIRLQEAALLLGCSAQHLRNLVHKAVLGHTTNPVPYRDLDGVIVFPMSELLEWSRTTKTEPRSLGRRSKASTVK